MPGGAGSIQYSLREPFDRAVASVCRSLTNRGLRVAGQLDMSERVELSLGIVLPPCRIVFVLPDPSSPGTDKIHPWAAVFLPFHVVISSQGAQTEILVQNRIHATPETDGPALIAPVSEMQGEIVKAIEAIAMRPSLVG
jgi:uncharacterized protein (DUF302 family)